MTGENHLTVDGRHVATLTYGSGDFPWMHGRYEPGPDATLVAWAFVERDERRELDLERLAAAGHGPETVMLDPETWLHALLVSPDGSAAWLLGMEPADLSP